MAKVTAPIVCKLNIPSGNNVEITLPDTEDNVALFAALAAEHGFGYRVLEPRNKYGSKGMPKAERLARLQAQLAELEASE